MCLALKTVCTPVRPPCGETEMILQAFVFTTGGRYNFKTSALVKIYDTFSDLPLLLSFTSKILFSLHSACLALFMFAGKSRSLHVSHLGVVGLAPFNKKGDATERNRTEWNIKRQKGER